MNAAEALQEMRRRYGLAVHFRGSELFVGLPFTDILNTVKYSFTGNIIDHSLRFRQEDDVNLRVKAISLLPDNETLEVTVPKGKKSGSLITKFYYNISELSTLEKVATNDIDKLRYEGLEGTIDTFLLPQAKHGMIAELTDKEFETRTGEYLIDEVKTNFSVTGGIRRKVRLGRKIS